MTQPPATPPTAVAPEPPTPSAAEPGTARTPITLLQPSQRKHSGPKSTRLFRAFRSAFRSLPIVAPATCRLTPGGGSVHNPHSDGHVHGAARTTGTLFGRRKARLSLALQESPRSLPTVLLELAVPTAKFMQELGSSGTVRVALECEKKAAERRRLLEEPVWTAFVNGRCVGYAARREASEEDLAVMQMLHAVSMGAGVLPPEMTDVSDGELTYMRAHFDRVVGSKDSETFYMLTPDGHAGTELSIFFVRI